MLCDLKEPLQKGPLKKKAVIFCWTNIPFGFLTSKQKREDMNQKAQLALMLQDHQREALMGQSPVRKLALSQFKFQSCFELQC